MSMVENVLEIINKHDLPIKDKFLKKIELMNKRNMISKDFEVVYSIKELKIKFKKDTYSISNKAPDYIIRFINYNIINDKEIYSNIILYTALWNCSFEMKCGIHGLKRFIDKSANEYIWKHKELI